MKISRPSLPGKVWVENSEDLPAPTQASKFAFSEMAKEWTFFNHGALFCFSGMVYPKFDPVSDWFAQQSDRPVLIFQTFRKPLFAGLDAPIPIAGMTWNNVLLAIRHEYWESLFNFLGGVATIDQRAKKFAQTFSAQVQILDPVLAERYSILDPRVPNITVTLFCSETNTDRWEVRPPRTAADCPKFVRVDPRPETVALARAVLSGDVEDLQHRDSPVIQQALAKLKGANGGRSIITPDGN